MKQAFKGRKEREGQDKCNEGAQFVALAFTAHLGTTTQQNKTTLSSRTCSLVRLH